MAPAPGKGDEPPARMLILLALLVISAHVLIALRGFAPAENPVAITPPRVVEVVLLAPAPAPPSAQPEPASAAPARPPEPPPEKPAAPKPVRKPSSPPKPVLKPAEPKKTTRPEPQEPPAEPRTPMRQATPDAGHSAPEPPAAPAAKEAPTAHAPPSASAARERSPATVTPASFQAAYLHNPGPAYPALARSRRWEGTVRLRVKVSTEGHCEHAEIQESSGHELLDEAALEAVGRWRFVPAKRGDTPISSWVVVPIAFKLQN
jgi:protein TonB